MRPLLLSLLVVAAACGDDGPTLPADTYAGTWLMSELTLPGQPGEPPVTLYRTGGDETLRGDVVFSPTGVSTATLSVRQALLQSGLLTGDVMALLLSVDVEPDRWVLTEPDGDVIVFTTALDGDHLVLTTDLTDPRHHATDPPVAVVVDRVPHWSTTTAGSWDLVTIQFPDRTLDAGVCTEIQPGAWGKLGMHIVFTARLLFERRMTVTAYSDPQCTAQTSAQTSIQAGMAEEEGDTTLRIWGLENGQAEYQGFTMSVAGDTATLLRTSCLPLPACEDSAPTRVVVRRAP